MKKFVLGLILLSNGLMAIELGKVPNTVSISGENAGKLDGSAWSSSMLKGKLIYKKFGKVTTKEIPAVIKLIEKNL
jgi:hypothetical protein